MDIYEGITLCYRLIFGGLALLFMINVVRHQDLTKKLLGVVVLLPLLLRFFGVK